MQSAPPASKELLDAAVEIAKKAGAITQRWYRNAALEVDVKDDGSPVTQADLAAERFIREQIERVAPGSALVGEEEGEAPGTSPLLWYVDPIDGTKGFSRGVPLYSTLLAVDDEHGPAIGVIHIPVTGETVWAGRGLGAWTEEGPAHVSSTASLERAFVSTSIVSRWKPETFAALKASDATVVGWGDGYGFLMAATGRVDAMFDVNPGYHPWDFAPLRVIFPEAGGRFSAIDGSTAIDTPIALASNGVLHEDLLAHFAAER